ncbi:MAG: hypothetical protein JXR07_19195 [Reichenbachiella sp.]
MKAAFSIIIFLLLYQARSAELADTWGIDYTEAVLFIDENCSVFEAISSEYGMDPLVIKSVVFPELLRYSLVRDFLETEIVAWGYVDQEAGFADFSIGHFQMKPSFVEDLESRLCQSNQMDLYQPLLIYRASNARNIRAERVKRIQDLAYQIRYLCSFISIAREQIKELSCLTSVEQVRYLATLYNSGLENDFSRLLLLSKRKTFPYGMNYSGRQYSYAAISESYYKTFNQITI